MNEYRILHESLFVVFILKAEMIFLKKWDDCLDKA